MVETESGRDSTYLVSKHTEHASSVQLVTSASLPFPSASELLSLPFLQEQKGRQCKHTLLDLGLRGGAPSVSPWQTGPSSRCQPQAPVACESEDGTAPSLLLTETPQPRATMSSALGHEHFVGCSGGRQAASFQEAHAQNQNSFVNFSAIIILLTYTDNISSPANTNQWNQLNNPA